MHIVLLFGMAEFWGRPAGLVMALLFFLGAIVEVVLLGFGKVLPKKGQMSSAVVVALLIISGLVGGREYYGAEGLSTNSISLVAGAFLVAVGFSLRFISIRTLGGFFSYKLQVQAGQRLCTQGIYALIRHPSYLGLILIGFGMPLAFASWRAALIIAVCLIPGLWWWIKREEEMMLRAFGEEYERYRRRTKGIIPFVL